jgi:metal-sulfur cluster biosynthetic enzyme
MGLMTVRDFEIKMVITFLKIVYILIILMVQMNIMNIGMIKKISVD